MKTFTEQDLINVLQVNLTKLLKDRDNNPWFNEDLKMLIDWKEMVELLIQQPVNLQQDGKVTVGF